MEIEIIINAVFANWIYICVWFSAIAFGFGIVFLAVSFLMLALIELEGKIRTEKVWREALRLYMKKYKHEKAIKVDMKDCIWNEESIESEKKQ